MRISDHNNHGWRDYQIKLRSISRKRYYTGMLPRLVLYIGSALLAIIIIFYTGSWIYAHFEKVKHPPVNNRRKGNFKPEKLKKEELPGLLQKLDFNSSPASGSYLLVKGKKKFKVKTSIDVGLQNYISNFLTRSLTYKAAVVVMKPENGRILAMASYAKDNDGKTGNICLKAGFPAASLFKIIAAAVAIDAKGFIPEKTLVFRGQKHTLYKRQLKRVRGRYSTKTSFKRAFSGSINSVFGKIGIYDLGKDLMDYYSGKFLFNQNIPFDLSIEKSRISVPDDDFGLAEIASGFNKKTIISPIHATLITSSIVNEGVIMTPWIIEEVRNEADKLLYCVESAALVRPIRKNTAASMKILMNDTVVNGTCRKAFRRLRRKKLFKDFEIGAKTGTINDILDKYKFDWLTAYAIPPGGRGGICITVLAVHGEKLGIRSKDIARYIINHNFAS